MSARGLTVPRRRYLCLDVSTRFRLAQLVGCTLWLHPAVSSMPVLGACLAPWLCSLSCGGWMRPAVLPLTPQNHAPLLNYELTSEVWTARSAKLEKLLGQDVTQRLCMSHAPLLLALLGLHLSPLPPALCAQAAARAKTVLSPVTSCSQGQADTSVISWGWSKKGILVVFLFIYFFIRASFHAPSLPIHVLVSLHNAELRLFFSLGSLCV